MRQMTERFLKEAFAGESQAHMKYTNFAKVAADEGKANVSRLFEAIAYAEEVHASNHLRALGELKKTSDNLKEAFEGENFEIEEMYPSYMATAELQKEKAAIHSMKFAIEAEKIHRKMYEDAKKTVDTGKDITVGKIFVCPICGYTAENDAPAACPVCKAPKDKFRTF